MNVRDWLETRMSAAFLFCCCCCLLVSPCSLLCCFCFFFRCFLHALVALSGSLIKYRFDPGRSEPCDVTTNTNFLSPYLVVAPHTASTVPRHSTCRLTYMLRSAHLQRYFSVRVGVYGVSSYTIHTHTHIAQRNTNRKCGLMENVHNLATCWVCFDMDFLLFSFRLGSNVRCVCMRYG